MMLGNIPSLFYFQGEVVLCLAVLVLLIVSVYKNAWKKSFYITLLSLIISLSYVLYYMYFDGTQRLLFEESIILDPLSGFFKVIILLSVIAVVLLSFHNKEVKKEDWSE